MRSMKFRTLAGQVEDISIRDVLRMLALAARSGVLHLKLPSGESSLWFCRGKLIRAVPVGDRRLLWEHLRAAGYPVLDSAQDVRQSGDAFAMHTTDVAFDERTAAAQQERRNWLNTSLCRLVLDLIHTETGYFSFVPDPNLSKAAVRLEDIGFGVEPGIDVIHLLREQRPHLPPLKTIATQTTATPDPPHVTRPKLFIVDDDAPFLSACARHLKDNLIRLITWTETRSVRPLLSLLAKQDPPQRLIVELVMRRAHGRGFLGGLEALERAAEIGVADRIFLSLSRPHPDAVTRALALGCAGVLYKPQSWLGRGLDLNAYFSPVFEAMGLADAPTASETPLLQPHAALASPTASEFSPSEPTPAADLRRFRTLLHELHRTPHAEDIALLILRFASHFYSRGAVFRRNVFLGCYELRGGFGWQPSAPAERVRIHRDSTTCLSRCLEENRGVQAPFGSHPDHAVFEQVLGPPCPAMTYTVPFSLDDAQDCILWVDEPESTEFPNPWLLDMLVSQVEFLRRHP